MKKSNQFVILFLFLLTLANGALAQISQGKILLTGTVSYAKSGDFDQYTLGVSGGYFLNDQSAIGGSFNFGNETLIIDFIGALEVETKSFGVFYRHYFSASEKFYFFLQPSFNFTQISDDDEEVDAKYLAVSPGFVFYPGKKVGFELSLAGLNYIFGEDGGDPTFLLDFNPLSPTLAITFLLGGK